MFVSDHARANIYTSMVWPHMGGELQLPIYLEVLRGLLNPKMKSYWLPNTEVIFYGIDLGLLEYRFCIETKDERR